jgi:hypothetical protein
MNKILDYSLSIKSCESDGSFSGYASVFGILDSQGEEVAYGAFDRSLKSWEESGKLPKLLWQHDYRQPIGLWKNIREDNHGLYVEGQLLLDLNQAREAYFLLKNGIVDGLSIGFVVVRSRRRDGKQGNSKIRILEEVNLQEVSLVTFAANPKAKVEHVKMNDHEMKSLLDRLGQLGEMMKH